LTVGSERLYHLALTKDWASSADADYEASTLGRSLADQGFIHCSFKHQVQRIADRLYRGRTDVLLLEIDPARLVAPVRVESLDGTEAFPHIYGPLNRNAVIRARPVPVLDDGRLDLQEMLA
jgi:uncharacterized protein (DUF952 family)